VAAGRIEVGPEEDKYTVIACGREKIVPHRRPRGGVRAKLRHETGRIAKKG
jgi:hypothetical protein